MSHHNPRDTETTSTYHHGAVSQVRLRLIETGGLWERILIILGVIFLALAVIDLLWL